MTETVSAAPPRRSVGSPTTFGGPEGYSKIIIADSFGSNKPGATITSVSQFNAVEPDGCKTNRDACYGQEATGWDTWMRTWPGAANIAMLPDHLEIYPAKNGTGFISSHFEALPAVGHPLYYEIRAVTGRGGAGAYPNGAPSTWPAFWLYPGNGTQAVGQQSELDIMETNVNIQSDNVGPGPYYFYFLTSTHATGGAMIESVYSSTGGIDITTSYNVYGCEVSIDAAGNISWTMYFNGARIAHSTKSLQWTSNSAPPSILLGWNPGNSPYSPAVMKVDYVRVWSK